MRYFDVSPQFSTPAGRADQGHYYDFDNNGYNRYQELIDMEQAAYQKQQYLLKTYNRAQQFGLRGMSIQEIILQLQKVNQRLQTIQGTYRPNIENQLRQDIGDLSLNGAVELIRG